MIAVDSSALLAIALNEADAAACVAALRATQPRILSAAILTEVLMVARSRNVLGQVEALIAALTIQVVAVDEDMARQALQAHDAWGKGRHPAGLNIMDCFSYAVARAHNCPLLFIGNDFSQTDIASVL